MLIISILFHGILNLWKPKYEVEPTKNILRDDMKHGF